MRKMIYIVGLICTILVLIVIGTMYNQKTTIVQVNADQVSVVATESGETIGYLHKGFTFYREDLCEDWCYFTVDEQEVKVAVTDVLQTQTREYVAEAQNLKVLDTLPIVRDTTLVTDKTETTANVTLLAGQNLPIVAVEGEWAQVLLLGQLMYTKLPDSLEEQTATADQVIMAESATSIYANESFNQEDELAILQPNMPIAYIEETGGAYLVEFGQGKGYIQKSQAQKTEPTALVDLQLTAKVTGSIATQGEQATVYKTRSLESEHLVKLLPGLQYPIEGQWEDWYIVQIGGQVGYVPTAEATMGRGVPVLMYHHILPEQDLGEYKDISTTITAESFEQQMDYLIDQQFKVLTNQELLAYVKGELILPLKSVLITFDDGLLSTKEYAYPVLKERGLSALQHIISARKDREEGFQTFDATEKLQFFTDEEMAKMTDVFSYEAHSFNMHILDPDTKTSRLLKASAGELRDDLSQNLEDVPGATAFAYPFGQFKDETIDVLKELNFEMAFTTVEGHAKMGDDTFRIKRFGPTQQTTIEQFAQYVNEVE